LDGAWATKFVRRAPVMTSSRKAYVEYGPHAENHPHAARDFGLRATLTTSTSGLILRLTHLECPPVQFMTSERRALTEAHNA
jgi:hypothetical protein